MVTHSESSMRQLTLRGFDTRLEAEIKRISESEGISRSQAALKLMRKGAGLQARAPGGGIGHQLDRYSGPWTAGDARELEGSIRSLGQLDGSRSTETRA